MTDDLLLHQQLLQVSHQTGAPSQPECSASELPQHSHEREQANLVNILAGVKRLREGQASSGEQAIRLRPFNTNSAPPNSTRGMSTREPFGPSNNPRSKGAMLFTAVEVDAGQLADQGAEATQDREETEDGGYDEAGDDEYEYEESANGGATDEEERRDEETIDELGKLHSENPDDCVQVELFGQEAAWNTILEGAQMVGVSKNQHDGTQILPPLKTKAIRSLVSNAQKAGKLFEILIETRKGEDYEQINDLEKRLAKNLIDIKKQVETVSEVGSRKSDIITDIYAHAIPALVETLRWGLRCRTDHYSRPDDFEKLKSIISLQDTLLLLCSKASLWEAKPKSVAPIINATRNKIFPYLRDLREAFANEHEERTRAWQNEQSQLLLIDSHERLKEKRERQKAANTREQERKRRILAADLDRRYRDMFGSNGNLPFENPP